MSIKGRADKWLKARYPSLTNAQVEEALELGWVTFADGKRLKKGAKLDADSEKLSTEKLDAHLAALKKGNPELKMDVVLETKEIWVVDKPVGVPSHPISLLDGATATHWAFARSRGLADEFEHCQPTITPHRLDTDTSGVLIVAKSQGAFSLWREKFQKGGIEKKYLAWCFGKPPSQVFEDHSGLAHDYQRDDKMVAVTTGARYRGPVLTASTIFKVKKSAKEGLHLIEATCFTGATHQIRVHLAHMGLPLVGDALYDDRFAERATKSAHHLLRACSISGDGGEFRFQVPTAAFEGLFA